MRSRPLVVTIFTLAHALALAACHSAPAPAPAPAAPSAAQAADPLTAPYVVPANAQEPTMDLPVGTQWSLPCKRTPGSAPIQGITSLECHVDQAKNIGYAHLAHIQCKPVDPTEGGELGPVDATEWLIAMHGGIWSVLAKGHHFWPDYRTAAPDDLVALRRQHPMLAAPPPAHEETWLELNPADKYSGTLFWHMTHDGDWCERQMPTGLGGGEHFFVQCFDRTGQLRGVALAKNESSQRATACGSLADMPAWIFER